MPQGEIVYSTSTKHLLRLLCEIVWGELSEEKKGRKRTLKASNLGHGMLNLLKHC
jgi:hypothetical protein